MKKSLLTLCCAAALLAGAVQAETLKIGVAAEPYPPFTMKNSSGRWYGFEVDLVMQICKEIKAQCQITEVAWDGIIPSLLSKKIDVIFNSMSITPEREKVIAFSKPYYYTDAQFIGPKGVKLDLSPAGMKGKLIGVQSSTVNASFVMKRYGQTANIKYYNTQDELNADMTAGRVDVMLQDSLGGSAYLDSKEGERLESKGLAPRDPIFGPGVGAGMRKEDVALKRQFDQAISSIRSSGTFNAIQKRYFKVDIAAR